MEVMSQMGIGVRFCWKAVLKDSRDTSSLKERPRVRWKTLPKNLQNNHEITRNYLMKQLQITATLQVEESSQLKPLSLLISLGAPCKKGKEYVFCKGTGLNSRALSQHAKWQQQWGNSVNLARRLHSVKWLEELLILVKEQNHHNIWIHIPQKAN